MSNWPGQVTLIAGVLVHDKVTIIEGVSVHDYASRGGNIALKLGWQVSQVDGEGKLQTRDITQWFDLKQLCIYRVVENGKVAESLRSCEVVGDLFPAKG